MLYSYSVFQIDYHERAFRIGTATTLKEARKIAQEAFRRSNREFPCFVMCGGRCVADIR